MQSGNKRKPYFLALVMMAFVMTSCAPVLNKSYMQQGSREVSFAELRADPGRHRGQLYILGGIVVRTKIGQDGSYLETVHVPVDSEGYFLDKGRSEGRFFAFLPKNRKLLDPVIYRRGRRITMAGVFISVKQGRIDEMEYQYPVFEIKQVYLWPREYAAPPAYYDPWFYPYPYYYWEPWWSFYYYSAPMPMPAPHRLVPPFPPEEPRPIPPPQRQRRDREEEREFR